MRDKYRELIGGLSRLLSEEERLISEKTAYHLINLGYNPKKLKQQNYALDFRNNKLKQKLAKLSYNPGTQRLDLRLKFYAANNYSSKFRRGIQSVIEEFGGKYTGCYACGKCKDILKGYTYLYEDGRKVFRCGTELVEIPGLTLQDTEEIYHLIDIQHNFFIKHINE